MSSSLRVDHVLLAVADLEVGAARLREQTGLTALPGGRHPGVGTANMIVPLGRQYLELIAVVDESEAGTMPRSRRVTEAVAGGRTFAGWAVMAPSLAEVREDLARLGIATREPFAGARVRPDGVKLGWRTLELVEPGASDPFFIEWDVPAGAHPGEMPVTHDRAASGISRVQAGPGGPLLGFLGREGLPLEMVEGEPGLIAIELATPTGPLTIR